MCLTCGCGDDAGVRVSMLDTRPAGRSHEHEHEHEHDHKPHDHDHPHVHDDTPRRQSTTSTSTLDIGEAILAKNDRLAARNRSWLRDRDIKAVNVMSSPGSGKTSLLERTISEYGSSREISVIEGDQETLLDAERIRSAGARAIQINTGAGCHLDAPMVQEALEELLPTAGSLLFIENVGNLVCPALFDVGEHAKAVVISVTEGDDKPLKYPHMFAAADLVIINKIDLLPYVDFDIEALSTRARTINAGLDVISLSVRNGTNMDIWYGWLEAL